MNKYVMLNSFQRFNEQLFVAHLPVATTSATYDFQKMSQGRLHKLCGACKLYDIYTRSDRFRMGMEITPNHAFNAELRLDFDIG